MGVRKLYPSEEGVVARCVSTLLSGRLACWCLIWEAEVADGVSEIVPAAAVKGFLKIEEDAKCLKIFLLSEGLQHLQQEYDVCFLL